MGHPFAPTPQDQSENCMTHPMNNLDDELPMPMGSIQMSLSNLHSTSIPVDLMSLAAPPSSALKKPEEDVRTPVEAPQKPTRGPAPGSKRKTKEVVKKGPKGEKQAGSDKKVKLAVAQSEEGDDGDFDDEEDDEDIDDSNNSQLAGNDKKAKRKRVRGTGNA